MESDPDFELFYSSNEEDEDEEEEEEERAGWKSSSIFDDPAVLSSWSSEAGLRGEEAESSSPSDEGMEALGCNDDNQKHADSLIESIEILLNMDEEKSSKETCQQKNETLDLSESSKEDKIVTIPSVDTTSFKEGEYFEPASKLKSEEEPMKSPNEALEHGHGEKPKEESRCLKKQAEPVQTAPNQTMVFTPQWKSDTNIGCFSCEMFPHPNRLLEVRRKEGPRHRRKAGEGCRHCAATIDGQADFLKLYQARNGPFKTQRKSNTLASGSELGLKEVKTDGERQQALSCESAAPKTSGERVLDSEVVKPGELAQVIERLKSELFDARVKQVAYMALNLALENMTPIVCSN